MNQYFLFFLAFIGGVFLAMQGGFNTQLSLFLRHPLLASAVAFLSSTLFAALFILVALKNYPTYADLQQVPYYLWFIGGLFSLLGISLYYYTIPKLGLSKMISLGLCGQLTFAFLAGHWGWFQLPVEPLTLRRILGFLAMIVGIFLLNFK